MCRIESVVQSESVDARQHRKQIDTQLDLILTQLTQLTSDEQAQTAKPNAEGRPSTQAVAKPEITRSRIQDLSSQAWDISSESQGNTTIATLRFQQYTREICEDSCNCICHLRDRSWWRSPLILRNVVGFLFLGYSGLSFLKPACSSIGCRSHSSRVFTVTYCVPRWLLAKAVHISTKMTPYGDPLFTLTVQTRTDEFACNSIYHLAQRNNIKGLEDMLETRMASPNDADQRTGYTSLHVSASGESFVHLLCAS